MSSITEEVLEEPPLYPLYGTTFTLHRVSPLHHGTRELLASDALAQHAHRMWDILRGEVLRGVRVGMEASNDEGLGRVGLLQECRWKILDTEDRWDELYSRAYSEGDTTIMDEHRDDGNEESAGILIEVIYEQTTYTAILLRSISTSSGISQTGFTYLPLLLTRMPRPLQEALIEYLTTSFDARISNLRLSSEFVSSTLEKYLASLSGANVDTASILRRIVRDIQLTIGFPSDVSPALKTVDITISKDDVASFLSEGERILSEEAPANATSPSLGPFTAALSRYLSKHLALSLANSQVTISKVACGAYVLGTAGKLKIFSSDFALEGQESPAKMAMEEFVNNLVSRASSKTISTNSTSAASGTSITT